MTDWTNDLRDRPLVLPASSIADAAVAASAARRFALRIGLGRVPSAEFAIVVSELATNIVRHAGGRGSIELRVAGDHVEAVSRDVGAKPGDMAHGPGLGHGLGAVRRMSDEVLVRHYEDGGVEVVARRRLPVQRSES